MQTVLLRDNGIERTLVLDRTVSVGEKMIDLFILKESPLDKKIKTSDVFEGGKVNE